ncbi:putative peptidoglycan lipid II flippase [Peribacillus frigoritolerans]|uniref:murein biosynthesis integral membrane protein MurJ n=1 Tax=Peribacillus frigoritolerans TaxID=450367 RepID=UPI00209C8C69|nr:lipid II flippase MurJ [Peribacillus frigoritolerans]MCP1493986.1 putative peptidoglycan lipid II flippase [Peribacillus frigoritolerans]
MEKNNLTSQFLMTICSTLLLQFFLLYQNVIAASNFGISYKMDAYNISFNITTFIFSFFAVSVTTVLVPALIKNNNSKGVNTFITVFGILVLFVVLLIVVGGNKVAPIFGQNPLVSTLLIILSCGYLFRAFTGIFIAIFQVNHSFVLPKMIQAVTAMVVVLFLIIKEDQSIIYYSIVISLGFFMEFIVQVVFLKIKKIKYSYKVTFDLKNKEFKNMVVNFFPLFFSTALFQVTILINIFIATKLGTGSVSLLTYSTQLYGMVNSLLVVNLLAIMFPKLVRLISNNKKESRNTLEKYIILLITIMIYILTEFIIHGRDMIAILFERGLFDTNVTNSVYSLSILYFILLPIGAVRDLFYRYFYGDNDTKTPFRNSILISIINIFLSIILSIYFGIFGIVLGTVLSGTLSMFLIYLRFRKKYNVHLNVTRIIIELLKLLFAMVIVGLLMKQLLMLGLENLLLIPISTIIFFLTLYLLKGRVFSIRI